MLVVFRLNEMLSWKPLSLSVSEYTAIGSLKAPSLEEMLEIHLAIALAISLIVIGDDLIFS